MQDTTVLLGVAGIRGMLWPGTKAEVPGYIWTAIAWYGDINNRSLGLFVLCWFILHKAHIYWLSSYMYEYFIICRNPIHMMDSYKFLNTPHFYYKNKSIYIVACCISQMRQWLLCLSVHNPEYLDCFVVYL